MYRETRSNSIDIVFLDQVLLRKDSGNMEITQLYSPESEHFYSSFETKINQMNLPDRSETNIKNKDLDRTINMFHTGKDLEKMDLVFPVQIKESDHFALYKASSNSLTFQIMGRNLNLKKYGNHQNKNKYTNKTTSHTRNSLEQASHLQTSTQPDLCKSVTLYSVTLKPDDFEYIIASSVNEPFQIYIFVKNHCETQPSTQLAETISGYSLSFFFLFLTNLLEHQFLQMLNMKDMMDLFFNDQLQEHRNIQDWCDKFSAFDCKRQHQFVSLRDSLSSNQKIKSCFLQFEGRCLRFS